MKKIRIGDLFEIDTPRGKGYFQYVNSDKIIGQMIRVFPGLYIDGIKDIVSLVSEEEIFFVYFPLKAAYRRGIVKLIGNHELPENLELPKQMRSGNVDKNGNLVDWHIIDCNTWKRKIVKELTREQKKTIALGYME